MKSTMQIEPPVRLDFRQYDRRTSFDHTERERIAGVAANGTVVGLSSLRMVIPPSPSCVPWLPRSYPASQLLWVL